MPYRIYISTLYFIAITALMQPLTELLAQVDTLQTDTIHRNTKDWGEKIGLNSFESVQGSNTRGLDAIANGDVSPGLSLPPSLPRAFGVSSGEFMTRLEAGNYGPRTRVTYNYSLSGRIQATLGIVPIQLQIQQSLWTPAPATYNFFRLSLDTQALQKNLGDWKTQQQDWFQNNQLQLDQLKKLQYAELAKIPELRDWSMEVPSIPEFPDGGSLSVPSTDFAQEDFLKRPAFDIPGIEDIPVDSLLGNQRLAGPDSSSLEKFQHIKSELAKIDSLQRELNNLKQPELQDSLPNRPKLKGLALLEAIKTLELGQTTPQFSHFTLAPLPLDGVQIRIAHKKKEFALVHGHRSGQLFVPITEQQRTLLSIFGDPFPGSTGTGDRLSAFEYLWNRSESQQLGFVLLNGLDKFPSGGYPEPNTARPEGFPIHNAGEFHGKHTDGKNLEFRWSLARSFTRFASGSETVGTLRSQPLNQQNALFSSIRKTLPQINLETTLDAEWVQTGFFSLGNPYLRENCIRLSAGAKINRPKHSLQFKSKNRFTNVDGSENTTVLINSVSVAYKQKLSKAWSVQLMSMPLLISSRDQLTGEHSQTLNLLQSGAAIYSKRHRDWFVTLFTSASYLYFEQPESKSSSSLDILMSSSMEHVKGTACSFGLQHATYAADSIYFGGQQWLLFADMSHQVKAIRITIGGSASLFENNDIGGKLQVDWLSNEHFVFSLLAEKRIQQFNYQSEFLYPLASTPYYSSCTLKYLF